MNFTYSSRKWFAIWLFAVCYLVSLAASFGIADADQLTKAAPYAYCGAFSFVDTAVNGYESYGRGGDFIGLEPAVDILTGLVDNLGPTSSWLAHVQSKLDTSLELTQAVTSLDAVLNLLNKTLSMNSAVRVSGAKVGFYSPVGKTAISPVRYLQYRLQSSAAGSLNAYRLAVAEQVNTFQAEKTRESFRAAAAPMSILSYAIKQTIGPMFISSIEPGSGYVYSLQAMIVSLSVLVLIPGVLLVLTVFHGVFNSDRDSYRDPALAPQKPRWALISWTVTAVYSICILFLAAVLLCISLALAGTCAIMGNVGKYIDPLLSLAGVHTDVNLGPMMDACFGVRGKGNFSDTLRINGETLTDILSVTANISIASYPLNYTLPAELLSSVYTSNADLISDLQNAVSGSGGLYVMSSADAVLAAYDLSALRASSSSLVKRMTPDCIAPSVSAGVQSSTTPFGGVFFVTLSKLKGFNDYLTDLNTAPTVAIGSSSGSNPTCSGSGPQSVDTIEYTRDAVGNWGKAAQTVRNYPDFVCDKLSRDGTATLINGQVSNLPVWLEDSVPVKCSASGMTNLEVWQAYLQQFAIGGIYDIQAYAKAVDLAANTHRIDIDTKLLRAVREGYTDPLDKLRTDLDCVIVKVLFNTMRIALCSGVASGLMGSGVVWVAIGLLGWLVVCVEFYIWRRLIDNYCIWDDYCSGRRII